MAQPPDYDRQFDFSDFSTNNPNDQQPGVQIDNELNAVKVTLDATLANLALIQRDDGQLKNESVGLDQLKAEITLAINSVSDWLTATSYVVNDAVYEGNKIYRCLVAHTSGVFATDLAAVKWEEIVDFDQYVSAAAASAAAAAVSESNAATSETNAAASVTSMSGTSTTTLTPAIATKVFTTQSGKAFNGAWCLAYSAAVPTVYMHGPCTYSGTTLTMSVDNIGTATSKSDWVILVSGTRGAQGATGPAGAGSGDMLAANNLNDVASKPTSRSNLGVAIGSNVQAWSSLLDALAALSASSGTVEKTGAATAGVYTVTAAGKAILDDADAAAQRTTLGLGTAAVTNTGTSAGNTVVLDGSARLPAVDGSQLTNVSSGTGRLLSVTYYTAVSQTVTMTIASPCVLTASDSFHLPQNGAPVRLTTTGALPTGLAAGTTYFVVGASGSTFNLSATKGGSAINTSGSQSGTHTLASAPYVKATNSPTTIKYRMVGGGATGSAPGGGSGGYAEGTIAAASLGSSETITVGDTSGTSSIGSHVTCTGASGASGGTATITTGTGLAMRGSSGGAVSGNDPGASSPFGGAGGSTDTGAAPNSGSGGSQPSGVGGTGLIIIEEYS